jgi:hypothetical protein
MRKVVAVISLLAAGESLAFDYAPRLELGIGVGACDIQGAFSACDSGGIVAHVFAVGTIAELKTDAGVFSIGIEAHHYSRPEQSDLRYGGGSGAFDYFGGYLKWSTN